LRGALFGSESACQAGKSHVRAANLNQECHSQAECATRAAPEPAMLTWYRGHPTYPQPAALERSARGQRRGDCTAHENPRARRSIASDPIELGRRSLWSIAVVRLGSRGTLPHRARPDTSTGFSLAAGEKRLAIYFHAVIE
jgi:hypothetical protein